LRKAAFIDLKVVTKNQKSQMMIDI